MMRGGETALFGGGFFNSFPLHPPTPPLLFCFVFFSLLPRTILPLLNLALQKNDTALRNEEVATANVNMRELKIGGETSRRNYSSLRKC